MKKTFLIMLAGICSAALAGVNTFAATIIVDNNPSHDADYRTLQEAVDGAAAGDTILIGPSYSSNSYGDAIISKKLYIYGTGYLINENGYQGNTGTSQVGHITLKPLVGSDGHFSFDPSGSIIAGLSAGSINIYGPDSATSDIIRDIVITRNMATISLNNEWNVGYSHNHVISQNIAGSIHVRFSTGIVRNNIVYYQGISCHGGEVLITNNSSSYMGSSNYMDFTAGCTGEVFNNIGLNNIEVSNDSAVTIHHNYLSSYSDLEENVYTWTGSEDAKYQLRTGSLAKGACLNGADCGAFAGATPYILSGLPPRPRITNLEVPATVLSTDTSMPIKVSAESRN